MQHNILLLILIWGGSCKIMASLLLIQYDPMVFQLTFTSAVATPKFQILQNNIHILKYQFISGGNTGITGTAQSGMLQETGNTAKIKENAKVIGNSMNNAKIALNQVLDTVYVFTAQLVSEERLHTTLQTYTLIFNDPLEIGNGTLALQCFFLTANKIPIIISFNPVFGTIVAVGCYLTSYFSILGQIFIQFSQLYALFIYGVGIKTTVYVSISKYLLMLPPLSEATNENHTITEKMIYINMCVPLAIVGATFLIGYFIKKVGKDSQSIPVRVIYQFFTYGLFHSMGTLFIFVILFNSIVAITYLSNNIITLSPLSSNAIKFLIYLSMATVLFYCLMVYRVLNPYHLTQQKWKRYIQSHDYIQCKKLHDGLHNRIWFKRNASFINLLKKLMLIILFFTVPGFGFILLIFEFIHLLITFISKPFREEFYYNSVIGIRIAILIYYVAVGLGNLYQNISPIVINYKATQSFMTFRITFFLLILLTIFILIIYEFYQKCSNLNYTISLVREENAFKIKITERKASHSTSNDGKREGSVYDGNKRQTMSDIDQSPLRKSKSISSPLKRLRKRKTVISKNSDSPSVLQKAKRSNTKKSQKNRKKTVSSQGKKQKQKSKSKSIEIKDAKTNDLTTDQLKIEHKVSFGEGNKGQSPKNRQSKKSKWIREGLLAEIAQK